METNELPEYVKSKIEEYAKKEHYMETEAMYMPTREEFRISGRINAAEFGYRLGLQENDLAFSVLRHNAEYSEKTINELQEQLNSVVLELSIWQSNFKEAQEQLKAKDEKIAKLKNDLLDALDLKEGNGPTALSMLKSEVERLREALGKCNVMLRLSHTSTDKVEEILTEIDTLLTETK